MLNKEESQEKDFDIDFSEQVAKTKKQSSKKKDYKWEYGRKVKINLNQSTD